MARNFRSFRFEGERHRLSEEEEVRLQDIQNGTVTLNRESDGSERVIRAADLNVPMPGVAEIPGPDRLYDLRILVEETLALDFNDEEIVEMLEIARRHLLLRVPR